MGQKLSSKLFFIYSPNNDGFYIVYISQGSVATQFRCGGMFSDHFTTNLSQNAAVKKFENQSKIGKDMDKTLWLTIFRPPCISEASLSRKTSPEVIVRELSSL